MRASTPKEARWSNRPSKAPSRRWKAALQEILADHHQRYPGQALRQRERNRRSQRFPSLYGPAWKSKALKFLKGLEPREVASLDRRAGQEARAARRPQKSRRLAEGRKCAPYPSRRSGIRRAEKRRSGRAAGPVASGTVHRYPEPGELAGRILPADQPAARRGAEKRRPEKDGRLICPGSRRSSCANSSTRNWPIPSKNPI